MKYTFAPETLVMPYCCVLTQCTGHRGSDVFPYGMLADIMTPEFPLGKVSAANKLTNRELLGALDPAKPSVPYIYDNFQWPHCLEEGINMADAYRSNSSTSASAARVVKYLVHRYADDLLHHQPETKRTR